MVQTSQALDSKKENRRKGEEFPGGGGNLLVQITFTPQIEPREDLRATGEGGGDGRESTMLDATLSD